MRYLSLLIAVFALNACVSSMGTKIDQEKLSQFVKGKTTYTEVVQQLGKPAQNTINSDGTRTITYVYTQAHYKAAGFLPFAGAFTKIAESENTTAMLIFDKKSVLTNYTVSEGGSSIGGGFTSGQRQ